MAAMSVLDRATALRRAKQALVHLTASEHTTRGQLGVARMHLNSVYSVRDHTEVWDSVAALGRLVLECPVVDVYGAPPADL